MGKNKQLVVNIGTNLLSFLMNCIINFLITPYIVEQLGSEANGFVKLANDFANYATLLTVALNSMASRYLMIEYHNRNIKEAKKYYSSLMVANAVLSAIIAIPAVLIVVFIEKTNLDIPAALLGQVRLTFAITFTKFLIDLLFSANSICFYLTNRLDKSNLRNVESNVIKTACTVGFLAFFGADISYVALATLIASLYVIVINIYYKNKLTPELKFNIKDFEFAKVKTLIASGIWNSVTKLSQLLTSGLSLLITNLWVGATEMGYLSVAKTVPNLMISLNGSLAGMFTPNMNMLYAEKKTDELVKAVKSSLKIMTMFVAIPNAILVSLGMEFYHLWIPSQPAKVLQILAILTVMNSIITGPIQPIYQIFTVMNKVKQSCKVMLVFGVTSITLTYFAVKYTSVGVYGVTSISMSGSILVALCYHIPYSAKYLGRSKFTFYPEVFKSVVSFFVLSVLGYGIKALVPIDGWVTWFAEAIVLGVLGLCINFFLVLSKHERIMLTDMVKRKLKRN